MLGIRKNKLLTKNVNYIAYSIALSFMTGKDLMTYSALAKGLIMPFLKIWIHLIFATKNRERIINKDLKPILIKHIFENAKSKNIFIDCINGDMDHLHILLSPNIEDSLSKTVQLIKGESSYWVNKNNLCKFKFEWQDDYIALSVSESIVPKVREYIWNQEEHHKRKSFKQEYDLFIEKIGSFG
jgi:putative transposase